MTEGEVKPIEEKEEKRKINIISQIDDLLAIQGQDYMKGKLKEALNLADRIIELAKTENLKGFIKDQKDLIARIKGIFKKREQEKREKIINQLKIQLRKLEIEFQKAFKSENFPEIELILNNAKKPLFELADEKTNVKWKEFKNEYRESKARKEITEKVLELIKESSKLKANFQFEELKIRLTYLIEQVQNNDIKDYLEKLREIEKETEEAEDTYKTIQNKIRQISEGLPGQRERKDLQLAIEKCQELIDLAKSIKMDEVVEEYSITAKEIRISLDFEELKGTIKTLNDQGLTSLKSGNLDTSIDKFKNIQDILKKYV